jgi:hypothetical protein
MPIATPTPAGCEANWPQFVLASPNPIRVAPLIDSAVAKGVAFNLSMARSVFGGHGIGSLDRQRGHCRKKPTSIPSFADHRQPASRNTLLSKRFHRRGTYNRSSFHTGASIRGFCRMLVSATVHALKTLNRKALHAHHSHTHRQAVRLLTHRRPPDPR